jgi:hypothetical protein
VESVADSPHFSDTFLPNFTPNFFYDVWPSQLKQQTTTTLSTAFKLANELQCKQLSSIIFPTTYWINKSQSTCSRTDKINWTRPPHDHMSKLNHLSSIHPFFKLPLSFPLHFSSNKWDICQYLMTIHVQRCKALSSRCHMILTTLFMIQQKTRGNWSCQCLRRNKFNLFSSIFKFFIVICADSEISVGATRLCCWICQRRFPPIELLLLTRKFNDSYLPCHWDFHQPVSAIFSN